MAKRWKQLSVAGVLVVSSGAVVALGMGAVGGGDGDRGPAEPAAPEALAHAVTAEPAETVPGAVSPADGERDGEAAEPDYRDPMTLQGQQARGLYFTAVHLRRYGAKGVIRSVRRAGLDAAVIDLKDAQGRIGHRSAMEVLHGSRGSGYLGDAEAFVKEVNDAGIYTIARITCFADPQLPQRIPEHAIQDARPGKRGRPWTSWGTGHSWLDPYDPHNHELVIGLAKEAEALGFDEIQLDYIRFPVDDGTFLAVYPHQTEQPRAEMLLDLLRRIDAAVSIPLGVDVFGLTAFRDGDPPELGQHLERWTAHVEVVSPMLYVNAMSEWLEGRPDREFVLIHQGVQNMRRRLGDEVVIRPFLQGFRAGADHWSPRFITRQVQGAKQAGADGFLFWNTASEYTMVRTAMAGPARRIHPFDIERRAQVRARAWGTAPAE